MVVLVLVLVLVVVVGVVVAGYAKERAPGGYPLVRGAGFPATRQIARWTLPAFRHEVHTLRRLGVPATTARTRWMFGFQRRLVRRCE